MGFNISHNETDKKWYWEEIGTGKTSKGFKTKAECAKDADLHGPPRPKEETAPPIYGGAPELKEDYPE